MVHAGACGTVMTLLALPEHERGGLSDETFSAVLGAITAVEAPGRDLEVAPLANALRTRLTGLDALSDGERALLDEWLGRIGG